MAEIIYNHGINALPLTGVIIFAFVVIL